MPRPPSKIDCPSCGTNHERLGRCADGVRRVGGQKKKVQEAVAAPVPSPEMTEPSPSPEPPAAEDPRADLRRMADALPVDSRERKALELLLARDQAREQHAVDERSLQERTGNEDARLPLPTILRDSSEARGRQLNAELDRVIGFARQASDPRAVPPREEVMAVKAAMAAIPEQREKAADEYERTRAFLAGDQRWICRECGNVFRSATMAEVRRKAAEEPSWKFVCVKCLSQRVEMLEMALVS